MMANRLILGAVAAVIGLAIGPLLGIAVDRVVERLSFRAEHRCVHCQHGQGTQSLIPIAHWRMMCDQCGLGKGVRYRLVDVATAVLFAAVGARFGWSPLLLPYLALTAILIVLSAIDFETHLLPNRIVWPTVLGGLFVIFVMSGSLDYGDGIMSALLGAAIFTGFIGLAHIIYEPGMGRGDVKLSLILGLFVGWLQPVLLETTRLVLFTIIVAMFGGGVIGLIYNKLRGLGRAEIPFGPALAASTMGVVLLSPVLVDSVPY